MSNEHNDSVLSDEENTVQVGASEPSLTGPKIDPIEALNEVMRDLGTGPDKVDIEAAVTVAREIAKFKRRMHLAGLSYSSLRSMLWSVHEESELDAMSPLDMIERVIFLEYPPLDEPVVTAKQASKPDQQDQPDAEVVGYVQHN
jgi:hypothetical protein